MAVRETRTRSSRWRPNAEYEVAKFADELTHTRHGFVTHRDLAEPAERFATLGAWNAISIVVLKTTVPRVPDFYQGSELGGLHLVDPDNRRPVGFDRIRRRSRSVFRARGPASASTVRSYARTAPDGRLRLYVTARLLDVRHSDPELFASGAYRPLRIRSDGAPIAVALARTADDRWVVVVVGRRLERAGVTRDRIPKGAMFGRAKLVLPPAAPRLWTDELRARLVRTTDRAGSRTLAFDRLLDALPFAVLTGRAPATGSRRRTRLA